METNMVSVPASMIKAGQTFELYGERVSVVSVAADDAVLYLTVRTVSGELLNLTTTPSRRVALYL